MQKGELDCSVFYDTHHTPTFYPIKNTWQNGITYGLAITCWQRQWPSTKDTASICLSFRANPKTLALSLTAVVYCAQKTDKPHLPYNQNKLSATDTIVLIQCKTNLLWGFDQTLSQRSEWVKGLARETTAFTAESSRELRRNAVP